MEKVFYSGKESPSINIQVITSNTNVAEMAMLYTLLKEVMSPHFVQKEQGFSEQEYPFLKDA